MWIHQKYGMSQFLQRYYWSKIKTACTLMLLMMLDSLEKWWDILLAMDKQKNDDKDNSEYW